MFPYIFTKMSLYTHVNKEIKMSLNLKTSSRILSKVGGYGSLSFTYSFSLYFIE